MTPENLILVLRTLMRTPEEVRIDRKPMMVSSDWRERLLEMSVQEARNMKNE